jgi:hypothetical protein
MNSHPMSLVEEIEKRLSELNDPEYLTYELAHDLEQTLLALKTAIEMRDSWVKIALDPNMDKTPCDAEIGIRNMNQELSTILGLK